MNRKPSSNQKNSIELTVNIIVKCTTTLHVQFIFTKYKKGGGVTQRILVQKILKILGIVGTD